MSNSPIFGSTRSFVGSRHALISPDGHVPSVWPGVAGGRVFVLLSPAIGACFTQLLVELSDQGNASFGPDESERFVYVISGDVTAAGPETWDCETGSYLFVPAGEHLHLTGRAGNSLICTFVKRYEPLANVPKPNWIFGREEAVSSQPFLGNKATRLQILLPEELSFDLAVNIFNYEPGSYLPFTETHVMEHGLLMLAGRGIYRLEEKWYPITEGDVIWMAPYCPQWFGALGMEPARYLYYKNVNRVCE